MVCAVGDKRLWCVRPRCGEDDEERRRRWCFSDGDWLARREVWLLLGAVAAGWDAAVGEVIEREVRRRDRARFR